jgi:predicted enzyme related to lactoylglutathione lyase
LVKKLDGSVVMEAEDTPYGRPATVTDLAGTAFKLRAPNH